MPTGSRTTDGLFLDLERPQPDAQPLLAWRAPPRHALAFPRNRPDQWFLPRAAT